VCSVSVRGPGDGSGDGDLLSGWKPSHRLPAITIQQPWAYCIVHGLKKYETRNWATPHRGLLAIHVGSNARAEYYPTAMRLGLDTTDKAGPFWNDRGKIVAIVELADITQITTPAELDYWLHTDEAKYGFYKMNAYVWRLENLYVLPYPITTRGNMGIWDVNRSERDIIGEILGVS